MNLSLIENKETFDDFTKCIDINILSNFVIDNFNYLSPVNIISMINI